jgi:membrane protein DedA with SNARE-associated domain
MIEWVTHLYTFVMQVISVQGPHDLVPILSVATISEFGVPFPLVVDTLLFMLGYKISHLWLETILVVLALMAGRVIGSSLVYLLARTLGSPLVRWLGKRFPNWRDRADKISRRFGVANSLAKCISRLGAKVSLTAPATRFSFALPLSVASGRLTPGLRGMTSVASGTLRFRYRAFALGIAIASLLSDMAAIFLGVVTGYGLRQLNIDPSAWLVVLTIAINIAMLIVMQRFLWGRLAAKFAQV